MRRWLLALVDVDNPDREIGQFYAEFDGIKVTCVNYGKLKDGQFFRMIGQFKREEK